MGLYDVIDDISRREIIKTDTGDNRIFGVVTGRVAKNYDKDMPGKICVTIPVRDKDANELQWARLALPSGGKAWGSFFVPEIDDQVLIAFEEGNIEKPYIVGCVYMDSSKIPSRYTDEKNKFKSITTRNGSCIIFEDIEEGEGDKDKITVKTAKDAHHFLMDNENKRMELADKEFKNGFRFETEDGNLKVKVEKKMVIEVGDNIKITLNSDSGVTIDCQKLTIKSSGDVKMEGSGNMRLNGANVTIEASSMCKIDSSGMVKISGSPINIG